jgi:hypothetical protein
MEKLCTFFNFMISAHFNKNERLKESRFEIFSKICIFLKMNDVEIQVWS